MPVDQRELINALAIIANERNVRITVKNTAKGAGICAVSSFVGGLLLGPLGIALGSVVGGAAAYKATEGCFRPLGSVLVNDLTPRQRDALIRSITKAVHNLHITDLTLLLPLLMRDDNIKNTVFNAVLSFIRSEMNLQIVD